MSTEPRPRFAVVGTSHWHHKFYRESLAAKADVVGYSDPSPAKIAEVQPFYGGVSHTDWHELLDDELRLDGAVVLGPHDEMAEVALAFIKKRIPLVIEKPGGLNAEQVGRVRQAATAAEVPTAVLFIQRLGNLWPALQQVGKLDYATFVFHSGPPERYINQSPWALVHQHAGGGAFINLAVHYIDLFLAATKARQLRVQAQSQARLSTPYDVEDRLTALLSTPDGISANVEVGYAFPTSPTFRFLNYYGRGDKGFFEFDGRGNIITTAATGETTSRQANVDSGPLTKLLIEAAIDSVRTGFDGLPDISDLHRTVQVVDAAYHSARTGQAVDVEIAW
jgi:predicted dehydrogenase